jgi:hypothetical protein
MFVGANSTPPTRLQLVFFYPNRFLCGVLDFTRNALLDDDTQLDRCKDCNGVATVVPASCNGSRQPGLACPNRVLRSATPAEADAPAGEADGEARLPAVISHEFQRGRLLPVGRWLELDLESVPFAGIDHEVARR